MLRVCLAIRLRNRFFFTINQFGYAGNNTVRPGELHVQAPLSLYF